MKITRRPTPTPGPPPPDAPDNAAPVRAPADRRDAAPPSRKDAGPATLELQAPDDAATTKKLAAEIDRLCSGYTPPSEERRISALFVEHASSLDALLAALAVRHIGYERIVDEVEDPSARERLLRATLPRVSPDRQAAALAVLEAEERRAAVQLLGETCSPSDLAALFVAAHERGLATATLLTAIPEETARRAIATLSIDDAIALALSTKGRANALVRDAIDPDDRPRFDVAVQAGLRGLAAAERALREAGLPITHADFDAHRASRIRAPVDALLQKTKEGGSETAAEIDALLTTLAVELAWHERTIDAARTLGARSQDPLVRADCERIVAFSQAEATRVRTACARLERGKETLARVAEGRDLARLAVTTHTGALTAALTASDTALRHRRTLAERANDPAIAAQLLDTRALEASLAKLAACARGIAATEAEWKALAVSAPETFAAISESGALRTLADHRARLLDETKVLTAAVLTAHASRRAAADATAVDMLANVAALADATQALLGANGGDDREVAAHADLLRAEEAKLAATIDRLERELAGATRDVTLGKKTQRTSDEELRLAKARVTLAGALPDGKKGTVKPRELLEALKTARADVVCQRQLIEGRDAALFAIVSERLKTLGLPPPASDSPAHVWDGAMRLCAALGIPAVPEPDPAAPFAHRADLVARICAEAQGRQLAIYGFVRALLKDQFGIERPPLPTTPNPRAVDDCLTALQPLLATLGSALGQPVSAADLRALGTFVTLKGGDARPECRLFSRLDGVLEARRAYVDLEALDGVVTALNGRSLSQPELEAIARDPKLAVSVREALQQVLRCDLRRTLGLKKAGDRAGPADFRRLAGVIGTLTRPDPTVELPSDRVVSFPLDAYYDGLDQDRQRLVDGLKTSNSDDEDLAVLRSVFRGKTAAQRGALLLAYDGLMGQNAMATYLEKEMGGHELGWALALLYGETPEVRAARFDEQLKSAPSEEALASQMLSNLDAWLTYLDTGQGTHLSSWEVFYGSRPDDDLLAAGRGKIASARLAWTTYVTIARTGADAKEARAAFLRTLADAESHVDMLRQGTEQNIAKTNRIRGAVSSVIKDALTMAATAAAFHFFRSDGTSWTQTIAASTLAGTAFAGSYSVVTQLFEDGHVDGAKTLEDLRRGFGIAVTTALGSGANMASISRAIDAGGKLGAWVERSAYFRAAYGGAFGVAGSSYGTFVNATVHAATGDEKTAQALADGIAINALVGIAGATIAGPTIERILGTAPKVVRGAAELAEEIAETALQNGGLAPEDLLGIGVNKLAHAPARTPVDEIDEFIERHHASGNRAQRELVDLVARAEESVDAKTVARVHALLKEAPADVDLATALRTGSVDRRAFFAAFLPPKKIAPESARHYRALLERLESCDPVAAARVLQTLSASTPAERKRALQRTAKPPSLDDDTFRRMLDGVGRAEDPGAALAVVEQISAHVGRLPLALRADLAPVVLEAAVTPHTDATPTLVALPPARLKEAIDALAALSPGARSDTLAEIAGAPPEERAVLLGLVAARREQRRPDAQPDPASSAPPARIPAADREAWFVATAPDGPLAKMPGEPNPREALLALVGTDLDAGFVNSDQALALVLRTFAARGRRDPEAGYHDVQTLLRRMRVLLDRPHGGPRDVLANASATGLVQYFTASCAPTSIQIVAAETHPLLALELVAAGRQGAADWQRDVLAAHQTGALVRDTLDAGVIGRPSAPAAPITAPAPTLSVDGLSDDALVQTLTEVRRVVDPNVTIVAHKGEGPALEALLWSKLAEGPALIGVEWVGGGRHAMVALRGYTDAAGARWYEVRDPSDPRPIAIRADALHGEPSTLDAVFASP